jgi:putative flippase GtrA
MTLRVGLQREFLRYLLVGGCAFLLDWGLLALGMALGWHYQIATLCGFVAGMLCCFWLSVRFVWRGTRATGWRSFVVFALVGLGGMALTSLLMWLAVQTFALRPELAKPFIAGLVLGWDFLLRRHLVFYH